MPTITDSIIPVDFCQNTLPIINFTTDDMTSKFQLFSRKKMNALYLIEIMRIDWLQMLDEYWDEGDTPYSGGFDFWPEW